VGPLLRLGPWNVGEGRREGSEREREYGNLASSKRDQRILSLFRAGPPSVFPLIAAPRPLDIAIAIRVLPPPEPRFCRYARLFPISPTPAPPVPSPAASVCVSPVRAHPMAMAALFGPCPHVKLFDPSSYSLTPCPLRCPRSPLRGRPFISFFARIWL
jgi:hypothetical protein